MITPNDQLFRAARSDFATCEAIIKSNSKSFYLAFSQLPFPKNQSVYAIYAFCRLADDAIDQAQSLEELNQLTTELEKFRHQQAVDKPLWRALNVVFKTYPIESKYFLDMLTGQRLDYNFVQPDSNRQLLDYAYYVASSVGLLLLPILSKKFEQLQLPAKQLGQAMQLTNILRDIGEDFENGRIYLPKSAMRAHGVTETMLAHHQITPNFIALWEELAQQAEQLYDDSLGMIADLDLDSQAAVLSALLVYREILSEVRRHGYDVFSTRQHVSRKRKLELLRQAGIN
ncbi:phytoene/squalene synthase family protein [Fructilactobacillus florum]|uniref:Dehydrosqualene synthase n=2 Tax=Fructilactobacillus florum TaxID=640331 RepID=A0A0R2CFC7_9LACO|nr:phytoene/squalene synthase family protein [Fructilactobacillus florum]KRM90215.1 dehydrosqualene synthase [Fructilactobacillus florum DSM 22689 = JCM 16035]